MGNLSHIRILFVEDQETDRMLAEMEIRRRGLKTTSVRVDSESGLRKALGEFSPDIIISDYSMPSFDGMSALETAREIDPEIPFIIVTGSRNEEVAVECMKAGADDYIIKENMNRLVSAIEAAIRKHGILKEKEKAETALRQSEERFRKIFEEQAAVKLLVNADTGDIVDANRAASQFYGWSRDELKKMNISRIIHPSPEKIMLVIEGVRTGEKTQYEFQHCLKNGDIKDVEVYSSIITIDGHEFLHSIIHDITEKKFLFNEIITAKEKAEESDRLKSAFLANISHEIRTPMNGIMGFTELLRRPQLSEKESEAYISIIQQSGVRMMETIDAIIDIAKIEAGQVQVIVSETSLNKLMHDLHKFFDPDAGKRGIRLKTFKDLPEQQDVVSTDGHMLESIMTNLIKNALKFTNEGYVEFGYRILESEIEFFVRDSGIGISNEEQKRIFDRFVQVEKGYTRNYEGAGLGLAITKAYVEILGGVIQLESELGKGSRFSFTLPVQLKEHKVPEPESVVETMPSLNISKILIAEDDDHSFEYMSLIFENYNTEIIRARNGQEAVELYRENPDVQIILMDIKMPVMDGNEAARAIREFDKEVKIIAQTAHAFPGDREKVIKSGCDDYLTKPIKAADLLRKIQKLK
jgi:PAS domain S-box-containing protein